ncbi:MAG: hypothetical protein GXO79_04115 [Chlorobi bacterium]|nr:hypothetical protein [Chlorobiota bacterium]
MHYSVKYKVFTLLTICLNFYSNCHTQTANKNFELPEAKLKTWFDTIAVLQNDSLKIQFNDSVISIFDTILDKKESFNYPFSSLIYVGKLISPDKLFRIINWNLPFENGTYKYYGYIQYNSKKTNSIKLYYLNDKSDDIENPKQAILTNENWFGALYYKIIKNSNGKTSYYTLLGWDGNNDFTSKKLIDILYFTQSEKPKFGKNIFKIQNERMKRVIFEYNNRAVLTLRYDEYLKMIVYEHLSPEKPSQINQFKFYAPDFSYDGLEFKNGKYIHHSAIDVHDHKKTDKKKLNYLKNRKKSFSF